MRPRRLSLNALACQATGYASTADQKLRSPTDIVMPKQCPQYSTPGMFHTNVCKSCETDFVELSTTSSDLPQETVLSQCIVQSQVGVNQNEAQSLASCGVPFVSQGPFNGLMPDSARLLTLVRFCCQTSTISGTIFEWPGQIVTQVTGFAGTVETTGETVTIVSARAMLNGQQYTELTPSDSRSVAPHRLPQSLPLSPLSRPQAPPTTQHKESGLGR